MTLDSPADPPSIEKLVSSAAAKGAQRKKYVYTKIKKQTEERHTERERERKIKIKERNERYSNV